MSIGVKQRVRDYPSNHEAAAALAYVSRIYEKIITKPRLKEMAVEAAPDGWTIKVGDKKMTPAEADGVVRDAFDEVRGYLKKDKLVSKIAKDYNPWDVVFKADGSAVITDDQGNHLTTYKIKNNPFK